MSAATTKATTQGSRATTGISIFSNVVDLAKNTVQTLFLLIIRGYQLLISPYLGNHCRYHPSCSCYADTAIRRFGPLKGGIMSVKRLSRCHPFHDGGYDPVPQSTTIKKD